MQKERERQRDGCNILNIFQNGAFHVTMVSRYNTLHTLCGHFQIMKLDGCINGVIKFLRALKHRKKAEQIKAPTTDGGES